MNDEDLIFVPVVPGTTAIPVVIPIDGMIHNESGFCYDMAHSECHENGESIANLNTAIQQGEITTGDADRIYRGQTV